jgi:hypothetical protein
MFLFGVLLKTISMVPLVDMTSVTLEDDYSQSHRILVLGS